MGEVVLHKVQARALRFQQRARFPQPLPHFAQGWLRKSRSGRYRLWTSRRSQRSTDDGSPTATATSLFSGYRRGSSEQDADRHDSRCPHSHPNISPFLEQASLYQARRHIAPPSHHSTKVRPDSCHPTNLNANWRRTHSRPNICPFPANASPQQTSAAEWHIGRPRRHRHARQA